MVPLASATQDAAGFAKKTLHLMEVLAEECPRLVVSGIREVSKRLQAHSMDELASTLRMRLRHFEGIKLKRTKMPNPEPRT